jgi:hypothetical protein
MIPLRDLFGFAVWAGGLFGDTVRWRDRELKLRPDGRILDDSVAFRTRNTSSGATRPTRGDSPPVDDGSDSG